MWLKIRRAVLLVVVMLVLPTAAYAQSVTLAWDASPEPDVAGYRLYYGTTPGQYPNVIDVKNVTSYRLTDLDVSLDYYFAVQAYTALGVSSTLSNEVAYPAPVPPGTTTISGLSVDKAYPLLAGVPVTWTASAVSLRGPVEYKFLKYSDATGWVIVQDFSPVPSYTWTPSWNDLGSHTLQVWVRTIGSPAPYEAWIGTAPFAVNASPVEFAASVDFPTPPGNPVEWTASAAGTPAGSTLEYRFWLQNRTTGAWTILRDYNTSNKATWTPSATGNYLMQIWVRRVGSTAAYETVGTTGNLTISRSPLEVTGFSANVRQPANTGTPITWTARVKGGTQGPIQYQFWRFLPSTGWVIARPYSPSPTFTWTPAWDQAGTYDLQVWVKNAGSTAAYDAWAGSTFDVRRAPIQVTMDRLFPAPAGTLVNLSAQVADTTSTFEYQYWLYTQATGTWSVLRDYSTASATTWTPTQDGAYMIQVWSRRVGSTAPYETYYASGTLDVSSGPAKAISVTSDVSVPAAAHTPITWTTQASGGTSSPLQYKFYLYTEGSGWTMLRDYAPDNTYTWTPSASGTYRVQVWVRSTGSTAPYESATQTDLFIIRP